MIRSLVLAAAAAMSLAPIAQAQEAEPAMTKGEERLAKLLEGRIAGEPRDCINTFGSTPLTQIDGTALVYRSGDTVWVNYTRMPEAIDDSDYLVIRKFSTSRLCRSDQVTTQSRFGNFFSGVIMLDEFVPYRRPEDAG